MAGRKSSGYRSTTVRLTLLFLMGVLAVSVVSIFKVLRLDLPALAVWESSVERDETVKLRDIHLGAARLAEEQITGFFERLEQGVGLVTRYATATGFGQDQQRLFLGWILRQVPEVNAAAFLSPEGELLNFAHPPEVPESAVRAGLERVGPADLKARQPRVGRPYGDPGSSALAVGMVFPLAPGVEERLWIEVDLDELQKAITRIRVDGVGSVFVVDDTGKVVFHRDASLALRRVDLSSTEIVRAFLQATRSGLITWEDEEGERWLGATRRISSLGWGIITQERFEDARKASLLAAAQVAHARSYLWKLGVFTCSLVLFLLVYVVLNVRRTITLPLLRLSRTLVDQAEGKPVDYVPAEGLYDHVAQLIDTYNSVQSRLGPQQRAEAPPDEPGHGE